MPRTFSAIAENLLRLLASAFLFLALAPLAFAQPTFPAPNPNPHAVATFQSIGLY